ncbi:MAG TPA: S-methyl-5-thioribose-1-phosphate isomerase [Candidatus Bilamarchaeaceae archaeon]|nr:S-methyl-5-thioribose-1-phosphate isomerase [Candidatus Bilamarchaeaceae archaeon]
MKTGNRKRGTDMNRVDKLLKDIKDLKVQGARNVAKAGIRAIIWTVEDSKAKTKGQLAEELRRARGRIMHVRPTEPMLRNMMREYVDFAVSEIAGRPTASIGDLKRRIIQDEEKYMLGMEKSIANVAEFGAMILPDRGTVVTHCHSSTVTAILRKGHADGKKISVVCCETRPRFQGRMTAANLAKAGLDVTLTVDMGVNRFMKKADMVVVGADAVTTMGDLINKVGTSALARIARMNDVSFYSAAELYKYDPLSIYGARETIEERDPKEVWEKPPKGVKISNPAFDATAARYINGYITEMGVVPPQALWGVAMKKLAEGMR